ncbi:MAG TPA: hypothetical protein PLP23_16945 [Panacibacter sp.]|nr:hypothetical protein [Panacibacter sp.]
MSQAFVKESDDNGPLYQIKPTIPALVNYIKSEKNYTAVFVKQINRVKEIDIVIMSNGLSYCINSDNTWEMCL